MHSSKGCEAIQVARAAQIGKDVIATYHIAQYAWKAYEGGFEIHFLGNMDPNGSIPDMFKKKMGKKMANTVLTLTNYLKHGTIPDE